ncbi:hypothetical protein ES332_A09G030300v1 [Gossypium tomentosum]|uniref:Uncharacterized protein n=1 Tax=Gossypium tomentosum TaxID=34277 RepID=A0A5D2P0J3_GOSTO|nr:hypothetical protein ES332_A09G030300v1 [Gossypium tomentosum]
MQFLKWVFFNFFKEFTFFLALGFTGLKAEPDEQNEMAGGGEGGGGSKPTKKSAEAYLKEVREMFEDKKYKLLLFFGTIQICLRSSKFFYTQELYLSPSLPQIAKDHISIYTCP